MNTSQKKPQQKQYHPPKLEVYGNISRLTQGGSSTNTEPYDENGNKS